MNVVSKKYNISHLIIYLGFLTTAIAVAPDRFFIHRLLYLIISGSILYYIYLKKLVLNEQTIYFCLFALFFSLISALQEEFSIQLIFRTIAGILAVSTVTYSYFKLYDYDFMKIFPHYITIALIISYLGLIQQLCFLMKFTPGYNLSWFFIGYSGEIATVGPFMRITSAFTEPAYFAVALTPAMFLGVNCLLTKGNTFLTNKQSIIVILAYLLSFSTLGYFGFLLAIIFNLKNIRTIIYSVPLFILLINIMSKSKAIYSRINGILHFFAGNVTGEENFSFLVIYNNLNITLNNFINNPLIGSGLDSHQYVSQKSFPDIFMVKNIKKFLIHAKPEDLNYRDASTMYLRIISELGVFGLVSIFLFLYFNRVKNKFDNGWLLQKMCIVFFLTYSLRTGQYVRFELWYFIGLYYCIKRYQDKQCEIINSEV